MVLRRARRVLILGGSGFVGRRLVHALAALDYSVRVPTRNRARSRRLLVIPEAEVVQADVHDPATLRDLMRGCDSVVNLVGILNERGHDGAGFVAAHVALAEKLVESCSTTGIAHAVQMSALKADAEYAPSHYLRSKGRAERIILAAGIHVAIFRPSVIFGADDSFLNRFARLLRVSPLLPLACPHARFAPVFVDDVAAALATAVHHRLSGTYELCGPDTYSLEEIVRLIRVHLGLRRVVVPLPLALSRVMAWIGEYLPNKPFSIDNLASLGAASVCVGDDLSRLGVRPTRLRARLAACLGDSGPARRLARLRRAARR
jgi:uncharacterized protein YbjT (DUF2867 family)